jgi:Protein of unknown function (DUF2997)
MSTYQRIEYRIGKDGKVTETVIGATGEACTELTAAIEVALGVVETQEYLPEYHEAEVVIEAEITTSHK